MKFKTFFAKRLLMRYYESAIYKKKGPPKPGFRSVKVQTETFFQKGPTGVQKLFLFRVLMNP